MFSKTLVFALSTTLFASVAHTQVPTGFHPRLAMLRSEHADGTISEAHALQALWYAATELKVAPESIPRIAVIHAGRDVANAGVWPWPAPRPATGGVVIEPDTRGGKVYYVWILGKPHDEILARAFVQILEAELGVGDHDFATPTKHVMSRLGATVAADELQKGMLSDGQR